MIELRHMRYFAGLAQTLHFGRAARQLHVTQPALSQAIRRLETEIGATLLDRTTRRVTLTPAGRRLARDAEHILAAAAESEAAVRRIARGAVDALRLALAHSTPPDLPARVSLALRTALPDVTLTVRPALTSAQIAAALGAGRLDLGVVRGAVTAPGVVTVELRREDLVIALPQDHPLAAVESVALTDLRDEPFVLPGRDSFHGAVVRRACASAGFAPVEGATSDSVPGAHALVAAGRGVSFLPAGLAASAHPGVAFRAVAGAPSTMLSLAWRHDGSSGTVRAALDALAEHGVLHAPAAPADAA